MIFEYGPRQHTDGEIAVTESKQGRYARGILVSEIRRFVVEGMITIADQGTLAANHTAITNAVNDLLSDYSVQNQDCGLLEEGGARTHVYMDAASSLTGTRVVSIDFPEGERAEYSTFRRYRIVIEGEFEHNAFQGAGQGLLEYSETISIVGSGGGRFVHLEVLDGPPIKQDVSDATIVRATQQGRAVGLSGWPTVNGPIWPAAEQVWLRRTHDREAPERIGPDPPSGSRHAGYPISWFYSFEDASINTFNPIEPVVR